MALWISTNSKVHSVASSAIGWYMISEMRTRYADGGLVLMASASEPPPSIQFGPAPPAPPLSPPDTITPWHEVIAKRRNRDPALRSNIPSTPLKAGEEA